jgi:hypothetical protein
MRMKITTLNLQSLGILDPAERTHDRARSRVITMFTKPYTLASEKQNDQD